MLIDSHAHLNDEQFDNERETIINNFKENNVEIVLCPGYDIPSSIKAAEMAEQYTSVYAAVGTHPQDADKMNGEALELFKKLAQKEKVIAIGEIGLDYYYDDNPRAIQKEWFRNQIRLAKELDIPYIVHDREAHEDTLNIMKQELYSGARGILHCYSGSVEMAREFIKMGFYIGLGGVVTFKNAKTAKLVAHDIPLEHILIETDSPYLAPVPFRGKRNEPCYVKYVAEEIARIKEITYEEVVEKTNNNFKKLFKIK